MTYCEFLEILDSYKDSDFAAFQRRLIPTKQQIIGIRTPVMRTLAKRFKGDEETLISFPDTYYETTFISLATVALSPYSEFVRHIDVCVKKIDNWATCDCFKAKCLKDNRDSFLPKLEEIFSCGEEFSERYCLTTLLSEYIEEKYFPEIENFLRRADTRLYYVQTAAAWLAAELLVKQYAFGIKLLTGDILDGATRNRAIQKAKESYRLSKEQKEYLQSLKTLATDRALRE